MPECLICSSPIPAPKEDVNWRGYDCPRCGRWAIRGSFLEGQLGIWDDATTTHLRSRLSHIVRRQQRNEGNDGRWVDLPSRLEAWHLDEPLPKPSEQLDSLILWIGDHQFSAAELALVSVLAASAQIGVSITRSSPGAGLGWLLEQEIAQGLLEQRGDQNGKMRLRLKMDGWTRYETLRRGHVESRRVLMAVKFNEPELDRVVAQCFRPAVARTGFDLRVLTENQPAGVIDDQLRVALRTSRFVVADLTFGSRGAYWESGFAEGLGRPVIYTCRLKEWKGEKTHFDTNHLVTIVWDPANLDEAGAKLTATIRATLPAEAKMVDE